jgi:hypothetical protein
MDGWNAEFLIPETILTEVDSAHEIVDAIEKYSKGLQKMRQRNPILTAGKSFKTYETFDDVMYTLVNARKHIDLPLTGPLSLVDQTFTLDLGKNMIFFYDKDRNERGAMQLDMTYSNWRELLYPDFYPTETSIVLPDKMLEDLAEAMADTEDAGEVMEGFEDEEETSSIIPTSHRMKMAELICDRESESAYNLWHYLFIEKGLADKHIIINYSGGGDSGCTDDVKVYDKTAYKKAFSYSEVEDAETELDPPLTRDEELDRLIWEVISTKEAGFYNNEGGYGEMILSSTTFVWNHYNYIQETEHTVGTIVNGEEEIKTELPF